MTAGREHGDYRGHAERDEHVSQAALLGRIDERTRNFEDALKSMAASLSDLRADVVTRVEFEAKFRPIQLFVYGIVAAVLTTVGGAVLALILR